MDGSAAANDLARWTAMVHEARYRSEVDSVQVSTAVLDALRAQTRAIFPAVVWEPNVQSRMWGLRVLECEDWEPGRWAIVDRDGQVLESGRIAQ